MREEVTWNFIEYEDNQPVIDLISKRPICVLGLLDEGCATGAGKDSSVLENLHATFGQPKFKAYIKPKKSADRTFILNHYAGEVIYTIEGFVEKARATPRHATPRHATPRHATPRRLRPPPPRGRFRRRRRRRRRRSSH